MKLRAFFVLITSSLLLMNCGGKRGEGIIGEVIHVNGELPEETESIDLFWSISIQPDASKLSMKTLEFSKDKSKMSFTPDAAGKYVFEMEIFQYGDELETQKFTYNVDSIEPLVTNETEDEALAEEEDKDWLEEEYEEELEYDEEEDYDYAEEAEDNEEEEYDYAKEAMDNAEADYNNAQEAMAYVLDASTSKEFLRGVEGYTVYAISKENYAIAMTRQKFSLYNAFFIFSYLPMLFLLLFQFACFPIVCSYCFWLSYFLVFLSYYFPTLFLFIFSVSFSPQFD